MLGTAKLTAQAISDIKNASCVIFDTLTQALLDAKLTSLVTDKDDNDSSFAPKHDAARRVKNIATIVYAAERLKEHETVENIELYTLASLRERLVRPVGMPTDRRTAFEYGAVLGRLFAWHVYKRVESEGYLLDYEAMIDPAAFDTLAAEIENGEIDPLPVLNITDEAIAELNVDKQTLGEMIVYAEREAAAVKLFQMTEATPKEPEKPKRVRIEVVNGGVRIDDVVIALKSKEITLVNRLMDAAGQYVAMSDFGFRTRDVESLPQPVKDVIESQPGAGTRIPPEWFN